jgi:hypothetical protein
MRQTMLLREMKTQTLEIKTFVPSHDRDNKELNSNENAQLKYRFLCDLVLCISKIYTVSIIHLIHPNMSPSFRLHTSPPEQERAVLVASC